MAERISAQLLFVISCLCLVELAMATDQHSMVLHVPITRVQLVSQKRDDTSLASIALVAKAKRNSQSREWVPMRYFRATKDDRPLGQGRCRPSTVHLSIRVTHLHKILQKQPKLLPLGTSPLYEMVISGVAARRDAPAHRFPPQPLAWEQHLSSSKTLTLEQHNTHCWTITTWRRLDMNWSARHTSCRTCRSTLHYRARWPAVHSPATSENARSTPVTRLVHSTSTRFIHTLHKWYLTRPEYLLLLIMLLIC